MCKDARIKDRILRALVNGECKLSDNEVAQHLRIPRFTAYTLLKEIEKEEMIETIEKTTIDTGNSATCDVRRIYPKANHFEATNSFAKRAFWEDVEKLQKKYWIIGILIASLGFNIKDAIHSFSKNKEQPTKKEQVLTPPLFDSNHKK